jgi:DNA-binding PadR family transcriptional regulator
MSGYSLMKQISDDSNGWKPSPGSVYPLLECMNKEGIISCKEEGRRKIYSLTEKGRQEADECRAKREQALDLIMKKYRAFHSESDDYNFTLYLLESMKKGDIPFKDISPGLISFRKAIFELKENGLLFSRSKDISSILKETIRKLKAIK